MLVLINTLLCFLFVYVKKFASKKFIPDISSSEIKKESSTEEDFFMRFEKWLKKVFFDDTHKNISEMLIWNSHKEITQLLLDTYNDFIKGVQNQRTTFCDKMYNIIKLDNSFCAI